MATFFTEIPTPLIHEDQLFPDRDDRLIYEHLKHFCSKFFPLPAVDVSLLGKRLVVTRGHKYLRAARELGYPWLRAIYQSRSGDTAGVLDELPAGVRVVPRELLEQESMASVASDHHVYFFDRPLGAQEQDRFLTDIAGFFERLETPLIEQSEKRLLGWGFPFGGHCGEFEALIPVGDPSWCAPYLESCRKFSRETRRIVSFQGASFSG